MENEASIHGASLEGASDGGLDVVIGLGANLGEPRRTLGAALIALARLGPFGGVSALYRTAPVGGPPQPDFMNAAVRLRFDGSPQVLIAEALRIERLAGRERRERWGPRTLDLDILWIRGVTVSAPGLVVPHPRLRERAFALRPLIDVAPDAVDPVDGVRYADVLRGLSDEGIEAIATDWAGELDLAVPRGMDRPCS